MVVLRDIGFDILSRIKELESLTGVRLSTAEKILLAEIGTVEQILSIMVDANVKIRVIRQVEYKDGVIEREVSISCDDEPIIIARSRIDANLLPKDVADDIKGKRLSLGKIIHKHSLETYRRIVEIGYDHASDILYRVYDIIYNDKRAISIKEEIIRSRLYNRMIRLC